MSTMRTEGQVQPGGTAGVGRLSDANRLRLDFWAEAEAFEYAGPVIDIHTHLNSPAAAREYRRVAARFGIVRVATMTPIEQAEAVVRAFDAEPGPALDLICVPSYSRREEPGTFTTRWLENIEQFHALGCRIMKLWAAPRGRDLAEDEDSPLRLDSAIRKRGIKLAYDLGYRVFMTHVGDPDTWFATTYADAAKYGHKREHYEPLEELLAEYRDVTWIGAHVSGYPEDLDFVQGLFDRHPNYVVDTSATKWMVRELSRQPERFAEFCRANPGRVLFGTDIVANDDNLARGADDPDDKPDGQDLYASRFWALRTLLETDYRGPSPIVDPDLHMIEPSVDPKSTADLRGCGLDTATLRDVYHDAAAAVLAKAQ